MEKKKGNRFRELTNMRFGKLLAIEPIKKSYDKKYYWKCICDCGKNSLALSGNLIKGNKSQYK